MKALISRPDYWAHLKWAARIVATWPAWKRGETSTRQGSKAKARPTKG